MTIAKRNTKKWYSYVDPDVQIARGLKRITRLCNDPERVNEAVKKLARLRARHPRRRV